MLSGGIKENILQLGKGFTPLFSKQALVFINLYVITNLGIKAIFRLPALVSFCV